MFEEFKSYNQDLITIDGNSLVLKTKPKTDFVIDAATGEKQLSGVYFYKEEDRDFILKAKVSHGFLGTYDACALMVMGSDDCWGKLCFEFTDMGTHSIASLVTNGSSDDANGADMQGNSVYLQLSKRGSLFAMHYSLDGKKYNMVRYFTLPMQKQFKVGFVAQSPLGDSGEFIFEDISLAFAAPHDMRKGI